MAERVRRAYGAGNRRWAGLGQLTLVEHALCPLDPAASLVENLVHHSKFYFMDSSRHLHQARTRVLSPSGLSASDEFYLWGLLALTFAQPEVDGNLHATPHYCLRQLGVVDQHARRGGEQYQQFGKAIERLSQVTYLNDRFYDPVRCEHRKVSFGFLSYSLPQSTESSRAWRIAWDPIFFDFVRAAGGAFRFDLAVYRELDPASRRLFLLLCKVFSRRPTSPRLELRHLAVNVLGFSPSVATWDLKVKVRRCVERLTALRVVKEADAGRLFQKVKRGEYTLVLERGDYIARRHEKTAPGVSESALQDVLRKTGFEDAAIARLLRRYPSATLREWADITLAARERFGESFFKKSPQAFLVDNVKNAARGTRTPPDWWHDLRRAEARARPAPPGPIQAPAGAPPDLPEQSRAAYERVVKEMFGCFRASGQPDAIAWANAETYARECMQRGGAQLHRPLLLTVKG
jgi:hypothetical protein